MEKEDTRHRWEKNVCIRYLVKDSYPQIDEEVLKLSSSKQITQLKQWANDLNRQVTQEKNSKY